MRKVWPFFPAFLWALLIFYLSSVPNLRVSQDPWFDETLRSLAHVFFYFVLFMLLALAPKIGRFSVSNRFTEKACFFSFLYAISDEVHQEFVITRQGSIEDVVADGIGILLGFLLLRLVKKHV